MNILAITIYSYSIQHTDPLSDSFEIGNKKKCKQTIKYENKNIEITEQESADISFNQFVVKYLEIFMVNTEDKHRYLICTKIEVDHHSPLHFTSLQFII